MGIIDNYNRALDAVERRANFICSVLDNYLDEIDNDDNYFQYDRSTSSLGVLKFYTYGLDSDKQIKLDWTYLEPYEDYTDESSLMMPLKLFENGSITDLINYFKGKIYEEAKHERERTLNSLQVQIEEAIKKHHFDLDELLRLV